MQDELERLDRRAQEGCAPVTPGICKIQSNSAGVWRASTIQHTAIEGYVLSLQVAECHSEVHSLVRTRACLVMSQRQSQSVGRFSSVLLSYLRRYHNEGNRSREQQSFHVRHQTALLRGFDHHNCIQVPAPQTGQSSSRTLQVRFPR